MAKDTVIGPKTTGGEDVAVVIATHAGLIMAGLAVQSLLAYALLPEGRGAYAVCVMFGGLFGALFSPGADRGAQHFVMTKQISVSQGVSVALAICLVGSALAGGIAIPLIQSDIGFFQKAEPRSFFLALVLIPLTSFATSIQLQLAGLRRFALLAFLLLIQTMINVLSLITLVWGMGLGVDGAIIAAAATSLVMITAMLRYLRRNYGLRWVLPSRLGIRHVLLYGLKYYVARLGQLVDMQVGVIILGMIAGRADVGLFAVASAFMMRIFIISNAVSSALLPRVTGDDTGRPELVSFCGRVSSWATGVALGVLLALLSPLIQTIFPEAFYSVVGLVWIIAPGVLVYGGANVLMVYFRGVNRPGICSWVVWIGLTANLSTVMLLYPEVGVAAAAWGITIGRICRSVVLSILFCRITRTSLRSTWLPQRSDMRLIWASGRAAINRAIRRPARNA